MLVDLRSFFGEKAKKEEDDTRKTMTPASSNTSICTMSTETETKPIRLRTWWTIGHLPTEKRQGAALSTSLHELKRLQRADTV